MHHQHGALDEAKHVVGELGEARFVAQEFVGKAVHLESRKRHLALGVHMTMPHPPRRDAVEELDAADLDDAMAVERVEPGRLGIEHDLAQKLLASLVLILVTQSLHDAALAILE